MRAALFHGTFLVQLDLSLLERVLPVPSDQPAYRRNRSHQDFLRNLSLSSSRLKDVLRLRWNTTRSADGPSVQHIERFVRSRYADDAWTFRV